MQGPHTQQASISKRTCQLLRCGFRTPFAHPNSAKPQPLTRYHTSTHIFWRPDGHCPETRLARFKNTHFTLSHTPHTMTVMYPLPICNKHLAPHLVLVCEQNPLALEDVHATLLQRLVHTTWGHPAAHATCPHTHAITVHSYIRAEPQEDRRTCRTA
jgi:hypothetical protein